MRRCEKLQWRTNTKHRYCDQVVSPGQQEGRATAKWDCKVSRCSGELYLKELAKKETCSREAGTDPGVAGGKWLFGLQGVLKSVISRSDALGSAGRESPLRPRRTRDASSSPLGVKGRSASHAIKAFQAGSKLGGQGEPRDLFWQRPEMQVKGCLPLRLAAPVLALPPVGPLGDLPGAPSGCGGCCLPPLGCPCASDVAA